MPSFFQKIISLFLIIILFPVFVILHLIISIDDGFPTIFSQKRIGKNGNIFKCYKFRSMLNNAEEILKNDDKLGQVLFNRNYAELYDTEDIEIPGGLKKMSGKIHYIEHEYCPHGSKKLQEFNLKNGGKPSNAYWPHYSFRPSVIKCDNLRFEPL